jgi:AGCS family alanine or glycine:cation symporter
MFKLLDSLNAVLWGIPVLLLIVCVGLYLSVKSHFAQFSLLPKAVKQLLHSVRSDHTDGYRSLCTALAATVGTGNLAGVAGAIALGGPGVVFWMWVCGFLGMAIKFAEVILAVKYRKMTAKGEYTGGPMYVIESAFPPKWRLLAVVYSLFGVVASFGIGNATQINAVADSFGT